MAAILGALAVPTAAQAATDYYVAPSPAGSDANPCSQASPCATIIHTAGIAAAGDTIHLAAGTYPESVALSKPLNFIGAGPGTPSSNTGSTFVHPSAAGSAFDLQDGGSIQNLRARGNDGNGSSAQALRLEAFGTDNEAYAVSNVIAIGGQDTTAGTSQTAVSISAFGTSRILASVQGLYTASTLQNGGGMNISANASPTQVTISGSTLNPGPDGFGIFNNEGSVDISSSKITGDTLTTGINSSGPLAVRQSEVDGGNFGIAWANGTSLSLIDSLVVDTPTVAGRQAVNLTGDASTANTALIQGSTIINRTSTTDEDALRLESQNGSSLAASLVNSVVRTRKVDGTAGPASNDDISSDLISPGGILGLTASHSSFNSTDAGTGTTLPAAGSGTNFAGDPGLVTFAGQAYDLALDSPLIDQGDASVVTAGELDVAGKPRSVDGTNDCLTAPDVGAYEFQSNQGSVPAQPIRTAKLARKNESVELETDDNGLTYTWAFSDGGTATGAQVNHRFTKGGTQTATLTSARGTCVATTTKSISIDGTPPKFTGISVKKGKLRFHANETAFVVVYVFRKHGHGYKLTGHISLASHRGTNTKKLPKRLGGKPLRGLYELKIRGTDSAGNHAKVTTKKLRI